MLNWALELSEYDCVFNTFLLNVIKLVTASVDCCVLHQYHSRYLQQDFVDEQNRDNECCAAKSYLLQNRRNFDVQLLGS